jgi:hypothetical protein
MRITHTYTDALTHVHTCARYLEIDVRLLAALSQGLREGRLSFTMLAGKPHCEEVTSNILKISMTLIPRVHSYPGCPAHVCKRRAQLRQRHTLVHTAHTLKYLQHGYKHDSETDTLRYTSQTQTEKPVITADIIVSLTELITEAHSAVPQDVGVLV